MATPCCAPGTCTVCVLSRWCCFAPITDPSLIWGLSCRAQYLLALRCYNAQPMVGAHRSEAVYWFREAAAQGLAAAMFALGECYRDGDGCAKDLDKARDLFTAAAAKDYKKAATA